MPAATMPSPGVFIPAAVTQLIGYADPTTGETKTHGVQNASLAAGIAADWSVMLKFETTFEFRRPKKPTRPHHSPYTASLKGSGEHQPSGMAVYGGVEIDDNLDSFLGVVYTKIDGRWGTNPDLVGDGEVANDGPPSWPGMLVPTCGRCNPACCTDCSPRITAPHRTTPGTPPSKPPCPTKRTVIGNGPWPRHPL